ncbi:MAG: tetratricopeptide repeat protein [Candidatus Aminicenantes bacterium]|nr:tetratricopeptide repeat protein [Candidatus Aminicenantes bacterium]
MGVKCPKCNTENTSDSEFCKKCATPLPTSKEIPVTETLETPKEELTTGSTFAGRYQIIEELGKGGMGKVYKAQDTDLKEKVAIKLLKPEIAADKKTIERFRNELKFARKIRHKNVCQMYDLNKEEGAHYITMEYVDGKDLKSMIRMMGQLSSGKTIFIAKQVCEGLAEAHRLGVIHRDLKPQNVMVDEDGNARIMDFGIARSLKTKGITATGVMIGTPEYMSPEQVEGKEVDQRSDIYSLGVILYEMVTGRVPFEGDTPFTIGVKHRSEEPKDPKELNTQLPEDLNLVILRCLEKDREKRYQSAGEVRAELTRIEKGIPTTEIEIPKRKPLTSREITVTFGLKKLFIPALVVIALIIAAIIIWQLLPSKEVIPIPSDKPSLAVMYFKNNTGDENLEHWRTMLSNLLIADLTQSKHIRVLSEDKLFNILSQLNQLEAETYSSEVLEKVAAQGRVNHILQGAYAKADDEFRINVMLQEASTGELIGSESVAGKGEGSIFSMVDQLTRKIKENFKLSAEEMASDLDREVGKITTSSPEAYKYYSEARKYHNTGEDSEAIPFYEKAVAVDPEFAMAYRGMAMAYSNLGYRARQRNYLQKALEFSDRVSDRERYWIQTDYYSLSEKTYDKAIEAFNKLLQLYPNDLKGNNGLGLLYSNLEEWDKAIERFEVLILNKDEAYFSYLNQASAYKAKGLYDEAREVLENYLNNFQDDSVIRLGLALNYHCQGKYDLALEEVNKAISLNPTFCPNFVVKGDIYLYSRNLIKAEEEYQKLLEEKEPSDFNWGLGRFACLYLLKGRFKDSIAQAKKALELAENLGEKLWISDWQLFLVDVDLKLLGNPEQALEKLNTAWNSAVEEESLGAQRWILYSKGLSYLQMKSIDEARRMADELQEMIKKGMNKKEIRLYHHLLGMIELEAGKFSKAIEYFKEAISLLPFQRSAFGDEHALFIDPLALAYYKSGDLEKAREEYERIISLTTGRLWYGDIYAKSFYMLGTIYEELDNKANALEHYEKFLDLWKDADPGLAEVEDARKRLAGLKSH